MNIPITTQALIGSFVLVVMVFFLYRLLSRRRKKLQPSLAMSKDLKQKIGSADKPKKQTVREESLQALDELLAHKLINQKQFKTNQDRLEKLYGKK